MKSRLFLVLLPFLLMGVSGCVPKQRQAFEGYSGGKIEKIGLLSISSITTYDQSDLCGSGGPLGIIDAIGVAERNRDEFDAIMYKANFDFKESLSKAIKKDLHSVGYEVVDIPVQREKPKEALENYIGLGNSVDAYLDIVPVFVGYKCKDKFVTKLYKPRIVISARLIEPDTASVLYDSFLSYGESSTRKSVGFPIADRYVFETIDEMISRPKRLLEGFNVGIDKISNQIRKDLTPKSIKKDQTLKR